ncbi:MAG: 50S ribosomal protein L25 [Chitinophagales bacterium]|nr:50S ribosomal protein L25 [Chitinophagales bacterium]
MKSISIEGQVRQSTGKTQTRELRKNGQIPCSIYGVKENLSFSAPATSFKDLVYTPEFYTAKISLNGSIIEAVMQDIQFDPVTDDLIHIDFLEIHPEKKLTLELPVNLEGIPAGVRAGGKINQRMKKMKVRLFPKDLIEHITIKIDHLELGRSVRVGDFEIPGVEFLNSPNIPIVSVLIPRVVKEETPVAATAAVAAPTPAAGAAPAAEKGAVKLEEKKKDEKKKEDKKK